MQNIIVLDDEKEIADLLEVYLTNEGYQVFKFYRAEGVLDCIRDNEISLAILDVMLPDIDGFQLCRKIRENWYFPIIIAAGEDRGRGQDHGTDRGGGRLYYEAVQSDGGCCESEGTAQTFPDL